MALIEFMNLKTIKKSHATVYMKQIQRIRTNLYRKMFEHSLVEQRRHGVKNTCVDAVRNQEQDVIAIGYDLCD